MKVSGSCLVALAVLAIPPEFLKLEEMLRNLSTRRKKRTEISSDLGNLLKGIVKLPSVNVDEFADKLPCPLIGGLDLQGSGVSKVGSRLALHETQLQKLLLVELKRTQMCTPTECNAVGSQSEQLIDQIERCRAIMNVSGRSLIQKQIAELSKARQLLGADNFQGSRISLSATIFDVRASKRELGKLSLSSNSAG